MTVTGSLLVDKQQTLTQGEHCVPWVTHAIYKAQPRIIPIPGESVDESIVIT